MIFFFLLLSLSSDVTRAERARTAYFGFDFFKLFRLFFFFNFRQCVLNLFFLWIIVKNVFVIGNYFRQCSIYCGRKRGKAKFKRNKERLQTS